MILLNLSALCVKSLCALWLKNRFNHKEHRGINTKSTELDSALIVFYIKQLL